MDKEILDAVKELREAIEWQTKLLNLICNAPIVSDPQAGSINGWVRQQIHLHSGAPVEG